MVVLETKAGSIYEPVFPETRPWYNWLKKHQKSLEGSVAYEEIKEAYEAREFELAEEMIIKNRHVG